MSRQYTNHDPPPHDPEWPDERETSPTQQVVALMSTALATACWLGVAIFSEPDVLLYSLAVGVSVIFLIVLKEF